MAPWVSGLTGHPGRGGLEHGKGVGGAVPPRLWRGGILPTCPSCWWLWCPSYKARATGLRTSSRNPGPWAHLKILTDVCKDLFSK